MLHQGGFDPGYTMTISITSHIHTSALSSVVLQRTKHNSQPLKIHYKKLLHNFICSLFSLHFCTIFTLLTYSGEYFGRRHGGCSQNIPQYFESSYLTASYWISKKGPKQEV